MTSRYGLITFDVYSALFDIEHSLVPAVAAALGADVDIVAIVRTWRSKQLEYALISNSLERSRIPFRTITRRSLDYTLARAGLAMGESERRRLMGAWDELDPWPEANTVLSAIKERGFPIGMLSNGDRAMLAALQGRLGMTFDHIFSTEQAGRYKPHPGVYALPLNELGLAPGDVLHVAGSATDVHGTKSAGLTCYWSNRRNDRVLDPAFGPDYEYEDLLGLIDILGIRGSV